MAVYKADILDVELNTGNIARSFLCHNIGKDDTKADRFGVRVYRDGEPESLSGCSIQGYMMRPNGTNLAITGSNTGVSGNEAWVDLPQAAYDYEGQFCLALKLIGGGVTGTVRIIDGMINNTFVSDAVAPTAAVPTYQEILSVYDQMVAAKNGSVRFDTDQTLTAAQKTQARGNIEAASESDVSDLKSALSLSGIVSMPYVKTGTGYIGDNGFINYSSSGSGYNYMMLIDNADVVSQIKHIKAHLGNNNYKYGIAFADANGSPLSTHFYGKFPSATASAQIIDVDVPIGTAKIYLYNRYSVLENPTITIVTNDGYEARILIAETDIDALQERNSNANMLMTAYVKRGYWYNAAGSSTGNFDYYIVPVESGTSYTISKGVRFLSKQSTLISGHNPVTTDDISYTADYTGDLYITFSNTIDGIYCCKTAEYQEGAGWFNKKYLAQSSGVSECSVMSQKAVTDLVASSNGDALNGKKWVACGDSFTHGDFTGLSATDYTFQDEPYKNQNKVYPFFIGRRTGAIVVNEAVNGSTMAYVDGARSEFSTPNGRYTQIPSDADYITLYFGINDSHQNVPIGTIDDTENTTFYGAWNIVMGYLITHYPTAKIGIIISNGCDSIDYPNAEIAIAKKWGVSYFDMNGDYTIPLVYRVNGKPNLCQDVINTRTLQYRVSSSNGHPNVACHEDESTFIESWIKSL